MYTLIATNGIPSLDIKEFVCDNVSDIETLPASAPGSKCYVTGTQQLYLMNANATWQAYGGTPVGIAVATWASSELGRALIGEMRLGV